MGVGVRCNLAALESAFGCAGKTRSLDQASSVDPKARRWVVRLASSAPRRNFDKSRLPVWITRPQSAHHSKLLHQHTGDTARQYHPRLLVRRGCAALRTRPKPPRRLMDPSRQNRRARTTLRTLVHVSATSQRLRYERQLNAEILVGHWPLACDETLRGVPRSLLCPHPAAANAKTRMPAYLCSELAVLSSSFSLQRSRSHDRKLKLEL